MKLFATVAELTKAQESLGAMELRATTAEAAAKDFESQLTEAKASLAALTVERDAAQSALAEANTKIVAMTAEVAKATASIEQQIAAQAAATVASLGHQTIKISKAANAGLTLREQYEALKPGPERQEFRRKHAAALANLN